MNARANIFRHWTESSELTRAAGIGWYREARREARAIARELPAGLGEAAAAGIIAALSPRAQWSVNLRGARAIAAARRRGDIEAPAVGLPDARAKAWRIAHGEAPLDVLGGAKVRAFYAAIRSGGDADAVIDIWAARAAGLDRNPRPSEYDALAAAYAAVADEVELSPAELQATVWMQVRGVKPSDPEGYRA